jgi:hypothetical protein
LQALTVLLYDALHNPQESIMMNVELNIAGFRFTREIPDLRRKSFQSRKFDPRHIQWRPARQSHAA